MKLSRLAAATLLACSGVAGAQRASSLERVTMIINPQRVCATARAGAYPNLDLIVANPGKSERQIEELRALVHDSRGMLIERRLLWQQALGVLGRDRTIAPTSRTLLFNPFAFSSDLAGNVITYELLLAGDPTPASAKARVESCVNSHRLMLPVTGRALVYDGYDHLSHHRRGTYDDDWSKAMGISDNFQRFGLDLVMIDASGRFFTGDGSRTDQWLGWGKPVRASAAGIVAAVHDGQPDNVVIGTVDKWIDRPSRAKPMSSYGNYVLINHAPREFSIVGHLRNGSVRVKKGDRVQAGQVIGAIGNSGASGGVHVHFERRTGFGLAGIETLPAYFSNLVLIGAGRVNGKIAIDSGDVVVGK